MLIYLSIIIFKSFKKFDTINVVFNPKFNLKTVFYMNLYFIQME